MEPNFNIKFMKEALKQAQKAYSLNEVPVGAVIVQNGKILARAYNKRHKSNCALHHAEILAILKANRALNNFRLNNCDIYITLEPCPMCAGAIIESRIQNVYFGAAEPNEGAAESVTNLFLEYNKKGFKTQCFGGILENECKQLMQSFFKNKK